jgi:AsmA protein
MPNMNVWIRRLAWTLGGLLLLLVAVGGYLLATFDPNRYQGLLTHWVKEHKQRTLVIGAPMELKLFPKLRLKLTQVSLSEHQQAAEFLAVNEAELSVDMLALLKRQLVIDRISAEGVRLAYRRDAEGRSNIDDLLKKDEKPSEPGAPSEPLTFDVAAIHLARVSAKVDDAKTGVSGSVAIHSLDSGHLADGVASDIKLDAGFDLNKPELAKGAVKGEFRVTPHLGKAAPSAELERVKLTVQGDVPGVKALQAELTGAVAWDGEHQAVKAQSLAVAFSGQVGGQPNAPALVVDKGRVAVDSFSLDPGKQLLALGKLVVALKARQGERGLSLDLDWPELDVTGDQLKGSPLKGQLKLSGPIEVAASFASQAPTGGFESIKVPGLKLDFTVTMAGEGGQRQVKGQLLTDVAARPKEAAGAFEALRLQASVQEPSLQPLQVQLNGRAALAGESAQWGLKGQLNDNPFSSEGTFKLGGAVPQVQAVAHFTSLDLNRLLPTPVTGASAPTGAKPGVEVPDAPVDMGALQSVDGQFKFKADKLAVRQYRLKDAELVATLQAGHLTLSKLAAGAWGGKVLANGSADAGSRRLALQAQADGINVLAMLKDVAGKDMLEGTGQVKLDIKTGGAKVSQLIAGLNGNASLQLRDGAVRGINLAKSLRDVKAQLSGKGDAVQRSSQAEKTDFTELAGTFQIRNGVAHNEDLSAKSPFLRVGGKGDINLVERRLNYTVSATVTGTTKGQDGAEAAALNGVTVPVKLTGPFDAPDWRIAWSEVAVGAIQDTVKSKLQEKFKDPEQQQKLKDKLLKGLFK